MLGARVMEAAPHARRAPERVRGRRRARGAGTAPGVGARRRSAWCALPMARESRLATAARTTVSVHPRCAPLSSPPAPATAASRSETPSVAPICRDAPKVAVPVASDAGGSEDDAAADRLVSVNPTPMPVRICPGRKSVAKPLTSPTRSTQYSAPSPNSADPDRGDGTAADAGTEPPGGDRGEGGQRRAGDEARSRPRPWRSPSRRSARGPCPGASRRSRP